MTDLDSGPDGPQPFAHLSAPNAALYRDVLRSFARAKERFIVHLRPEDVAAELRRDSDEQLAQGLDRLVEWGNLPAARLLQRPSVDGDLGSALGHRDEGPRRPRGGRPGPHRPPHRPGP
ncbi:hypothetical protein GCM10010402_17150 [Actinomadura luteofluorescens]|uniref:DUF2397 domain-containing protein n=1 Tax=Actinomadura luteofluorescens TaxID=46163 RepID=UPI002164431F|nr:DUF2397 domain-containing protein [Actinomadura glauciflava]